MYSRAEIITYRMLLTFGFGMLALSFWMMANTPAPSEYAGASSATIAIGMQP